MHGLIHDHSDAARGRREQALTLTLTLTILLLFATTTVPAGDSAHHITRQTALKAERKDAAERKGQRNERIEGNEREG